MYTPIINPETGLPRGAVDGFAPELGITTLEEYFNWLPELKRDVEGKPTKYTILPLDEPHFVINANTRAINIPADFKKNGIAVQGDDLAEVVYFEIDRYFDAMDLNNCEIYIQWETPRTADSTIIKSISDVYIRDIESQPGKLIFGWAISDAITVASGNLKFSVKFLQWDTNAEGKKTIAYSLNTLTAQVAIQQSIGIDLEKDTYIPDNANDRLLERIKESEVVGGLQAAVPYFLENIEELSDGYDIVPNHTDGTLKIYAVATADDTGAVSYVWKKRGLKLDNSSEEAELEIANTVTEMVPVEEKSGDYPVLKVNHNYYLANSENSYIPYSGGKTIEELKDAYPDTAKIPVFYEKKAMLEVSEAGIYTVEARNRIFNSISKTRSNSAIFKCPAPIGIDNSKETVYGHIIDTDSAVLVPPYNKTPVGDMSFQWYKAPEKNLTREVYEVGGLLDGAQVSYGEEAIRVMFADNTAWKDQSATTGEGGDPNSFYFSIKTYAPEGAVYFKEGQTGLNRADGTGESTIEDALSVLEAERELVGAGGVDPVKGAYRINWLPAAVKENGMWKYYAKDVTKDRYIGWAQVIEWYNADKQLIKTDFVKIQLSNEIGFNAMENFQEIDGATGNSFRALEEGLYMAEITRTRNRRSISEKSIEYRVTEAPKVPVFADGIFEADVKLSAKELEAGASFEIKMDDAVKFDEYEITWMFYRQDMAGYTGPDTEIYKELVTTNSSRFNPVSEQFDEIFAKHNIKDRDGSYYALVRTKRNGIFSASTTRPDYGKMFVVTGYEEAVSEE